MLKKFFISMLGSIAGFWISVIIMVFAGIATVGALIASGSDAKTEVGKKSVLYLDLSGTMPEREQPQGIWEMIQSTESDGEALIDILDAIRLAKNDSKIEGIYIKAEGASAGTASREEIVSALQDFKTSGKWIISYGDSYSQGDYILASLADDVILNPMGSVDVHGVASQTPFFKDLFDKVGVKINVVRVGTFKSAVEPFMTTEMSPASRLQTQVMIDSIWDYSTGVIADGRKVSKADVNMWADSISAMWRGEKALENKLVTSLKYNRLVEQMLKDKLDLGEDDDIAFVTPSEYMSTQKGHSATDDHVAVLFALGDIVDDGEGGIVGTQMVPDIIDLADDDNVKALVLRVNSGGGSAFASEQIWEALEYFKSKGKPFYVSMGDMAASGGYYISCGADKIFADRTTLTGSIGVFGIIPDFSNFINDKLGVHFSMVQTNPNANFPDVLTGLSEQQIAALQNSVESTYDTFTRRVADGRGLSQDSVKVIAEGRVWTGGAALTLGLVDEIGGLNETVKEICGKAELETDAVVYYPNLETKFMQELLSEAKKNVSIGSVNINAQTLKMIRMIDELQRMNPVQARMPQVELK